MSRPIFMSEESDRRSDYEYDKRRDERGDRLHVTNAEQIRNSMHEPESENKAAKHKFKIIEGRMVKVESDDEQS